MTFEVQIGSHRGAAAKPPPPCGGRPKAAPLFVLEKSSHILINSLIYEYINFVFFWCP